MTTNERLAAARRQEQGKGKERAEDIELDSVGRPGAGSRSMASRASLARAGSGRGSRGSASHMTAADSAGYVSDCKICSPLAMRPFASCVVRVPIMHFPGNFSELASGAVHAMTK
jgi:hypothetical protein